MRWTGRMLLLTLTGLVAACAASGCSASRRELYGPDDPLTRIPAMKRAVHERDLRILSRLVNDLESQDSAVRLFAIESLERLTGQRLGFQYYDPEVQRAAAVQRWRDWLSRQQGGAGAESAEPPTSQPTSPPATQPAAGLAAA